MIYSHNLTHSLSNSLFKHILTNTSNTNKQIANTTDDSEAEALSKLKQNPFKCRYYRNKFPKADDLVMVNVENVENLGAYVTLLEYSKIEGMVLLSELSRRRIRSINKLIRVGRKEVVLVLRVDSDKGYVDLSKKRVLAEDVQDFENRYNKAKHVHSILYNVAKRLNVLLLDLYEAVAWPLYDRFPHAYDGFRHALINQDEVFTKEMDIPANVIQALMRDIRLKMASKPKKIRADVEVQCFTQEGIDAIKAGLLAGRDMVKEKYVLFENVTSFSRFYRATQITRISL